MNRLIPTIYNKISPTVMAYQLSGLPLQISRRRGEIRIINEERLLRVVLLHRSSPIRNEYVQVEYHLEKGNFYTCKVLSAENTIASALECLSGWAGYPECDDVD